MDIKEKELLTVEEASYNWYYKAKFSLLINAIKKYKLKKESYLADIGSGVGVFLAMLEKEKIFESTHIFGVDPAYEKPEKVIGGNSYIFPELDFDKKFDIITMMDVLEHVKEDRLLLQKASEFCSCNGIIFITVPAFMFLWSDHDRVLSHYRRYTLKALSNLIKSVHGIKLFESYYFYSSIFPLVFIIRFLKRNFFRSEKLKSDMVKYPEWINFSLRKICELELKISRFNKFFGLTAVAVCRKI